MPNEGLSQDGTMSSDPFIKQVRLQNFMSHKNFEINLGPSMNIIVGTNGSGKSSILTGIMVALGSRAKATSRGDSISSFVQAGQRRAWITLKLHIPRSFRSTYEKYGSEVTVTRIIDASGPSRYELRDSLGNIVKKAGAKEVQQICLEFGMYPDNELAMLSQENAKEFLVNASEKVKYEKLRRALLQNLIAKEQREIEAAEQRHKLIIDRLTIRKQNAQGLEDRAADVLARAGRRAGRITRLKLIRLLLAWRNVDEAARKANRISKQISEAETALAALVAEADDSRRTALEGRLESLQTQDGEAQERLSAARDALELSSQAVRDLENEIVEYASEIEALEGKVKDLAQTAQSLEDAAVQTSPEALAARRESSTRKREDAESELKSLRQRQLELTRLVEEYQDGVADIERRQERIAHERDGLNENICELQTELKQLSLSSQGRQTRPQDAKVIRLQQAVDREKWRTKPIGPLWQHIEISDDGADFSPALERLWNATLESWWVENDEDHEKLYRLASRAQVGKLRVVSRRDDPFDFSSSLPRKSHDYVRVADIVNTDNDAIKRILVDLNHIEGLVLVRGSQAAFSVHGTDRKVKNSLAVVKGSNGTRRYIQVSGRVGRSDSSTVQPVPFVRMKIGTQARRRHINEELAALDSQVAQLDSQYKTENSRLRQLRQTLEDNQRSLQRLNQSVVRTRAALDEAEREILHLDTDVQTQDNTEEIEALRAEIREIKRNIEDGLMVLDAKNDELSKSKEQLEAHRSAKISLEEEHSTTSNELRSIQRELRNIDTQMSLARDRVIRQERRIEDLEDSLRSAEIFRDERESVASSMGPRPDEEPRNENYDLFSKSHSELEKTLKDIETEEEEIVSAEKEVTRALEDRQDAEHLRLEIERNENEIRELADMIKVRHDTRVQNERRAWEELKDRISNAFENTLMKRQFVGKLEIDDVKQKLVTQAAPEGSVNRDAVTLSGGEKSFTQVALLMAVWEAMEVGFVAMDEYDVYMDKANRSMSLAILSETVTRHSMQGILITPQDVDTARLDPATFKMHKLAPARE